MKEQHLNEIKAILVLAFGLILLASLISFVPEDLSWYTSHPNFPAKNLIKVAGAYMAGSSFFILGYSSYALVVFLFFWSWNQFINQELKFTFVKFIGLVMLMFVISSLLGLTNLTEADVRFNRAGFVGFLISDYLLTYLGVMGSYILLIALGLMLTVAVTAELIVTPFVFYFVDKGPVFLNFFQKSFQNSKKAPGKEKAKQPWTPPRLNLNLPKKVAPQKAVPPPPPVKQKEEKSKFFGFGEKKEEKEVKEEKAEPVAMKDQAPLPPPPKPKIKIAETNQPQLAMQQPQMVGDYHLPSLDLLEDPPSVSSDIIQNDLMVGARVLEETLASFGVGARVADIERGPAITRYELEPGPGVKVQKFTTLTDDIALAMRAATVRIVAPIPGKSRVGIEVPNSASAAVFLKDVLNTDEFRNSKSKLTLCLGKDIAGKSMVADLAEMPHMLIAGTTGSGKTVCVNSIIMSMLFNASPREVRFVMIDPKMVEMAQYNGIPHLLCPTVTDAKKAVNVLNWLVGEMENRYKQLSKVGARNIKGFNEKGNQMPYIVVVIDELADLMQVAGKAVESSITRLAQLSRAVGIHLILATQRPSVNVITGVIKANFPARISFKVASKVDSRTVLDANGAESLLGKGDMLFMKPGDAKPTRGQCNYVKDDEIHRVIDFIKGQQDPIYDESIINQQKAASSGGNNDEGDPLFDEAVKLVVETNQASVSILQRRMRLGYTRAARLIDLMEQHGIVGPYVGSKPRDILVDREQWLLENSASDNNGASAPEEKPAAEGEKA